MATPAISTNGQLAYDVDADTVAEFDLNSLRWEYSSESLQMVQTHVNTNGMRGTRSRRKERRRTAREDIGGNLLLQPTAVELNTLLYLMLGTAESADSFVLAETLPSFSLLFDRITARFIYTGLVVNRATFAGSSGGLITLSLDLLGKTEVVDASTAFDVGANIPAVDTGGVYVFSDVTYSLPADASATEVQSFAITIDNVLDPNHFYNSLTRTQLVPTDRIITVNMVLAYDADTKDLYDQASAANSGTLTLTNGGISTLFTFANLGTPAISPVGGGRGNEILLNLNMSAEMSSTTKELVVTHDSAA